MVNKNSGRAAKGSRYCLQNYMCTDPESLTDLILASSTSLLSFSCGTIKWVSPDPNNNFYEYMDGFIRGLGIEIASSGKPWQTPQGCKFWEFRNN